MAKKVTDAAILQLLEAEDAAAPAGRVTDPELLRQLEGAEPPPASPVAQMPAFDAMGNPTGATVDAPPPTTMPYGEQMGNVGRVVDNAVRLLANGATFGLADKAAGGMDALTGQAESYDKGATAQRARTQEIRDAAPIASAIAEGVGGLAGGASLMRNGVTLAGRVGPKMWQRFLGYGAEGAAYGAAHGAGNTYSENVGDYLDNAASGAKWGAMVGGALPVIGGTAGLIAKNLPTLARSDIPGAGWGARALLRAASRADAPGLARVNSDTAMLVDAGPAMTGLGQGAATGTGLGRTALVNALRDRDAGTGQRLAESVDEILGPARVPSQVERGLAASRQQLSPEYAAALKDARAVDTQPLAEALEAAIPNARGAASNAIRDVRQMLDIPGAPGNLDPHPRALLATRQAIDGVLAKETNTDALRVLADARRAVDAELTKAVPGIKAIDAKYQELARQSEGLQRGGQVLDGGKTAIRPAEMADEITAAVQPAGEFVGPSGAAHQMRTGARADIDRIVGTQVNDLNALERTLGTPQDWNSQKLGQLFGDDRRSALVDVLSRERNQRRAYQDIVQGSQTAQRSAAARSMEGSDNVPLDTTLTGIGGRVSQALLRVLVGASRDSTKNQLGELLSQRGPGARALAEALMAGNASREERARLLSRAASSPQWIGLIAPSLRPSADAQ